MMWIKTQSEGYVNADYIKSLHIYSHYESMVKIDNTICAVMGVDRIDLWCYDDRDNAQESMNKLVEAMCNGLRGEFSFE